MNTQQIDKYYDLNQNKPSSTKRKAAWFPGAKKFKKGTAPITPFTEKLEIVHGQSVCVKQYAASEIAE